MNRDDSHLARSPKVTFVTCARGSWIIWLELLFTSHHSGTTAPDSLANTISEFGLTCEYIRERKKRGKASRKDLAQQQAATAAGGSGAPKSEESSTPQSSDKAAESIHSGSPKLPEGQRSLPEPSGRSASIATTRAEMDAAPIYQNRTMSMSAIDSMPEAEMHHHMTESMQSIHPMQPHA